MTQTSSGDEASGAIAGPRGANQQILDRLEAVGEFDSAIRARFDEALGSPDNHTRALRSIELVDSLWRSDPGLGAPPFIDLVYADEQDHAYYGSYRDHVVHSLQVYILGLDIYNYQPMLRELLTPQGDDARFRRRWMIAALAHDHGYVAEVAGRFEIPEPLQRRLDSPLLAFTDVIAEGAQLPLGGHTLRHQPSARFFENLQEYEGDRLLDVVAAKAGPLSLGAGENPLQDYYDFVREQGWGGRDHGLISVLLLLQLHHRLEAQVAGIEWQNVSSDLLTPAERRLLEELPALLRSAREDLLGACAAIAVHNVRRDVWSKPQLTLAESQFRLRLGDFRIELAASPLAWFLGFCDTLQCWNRPQAHGDQHASDRFYPDSQIQIDQADGEVVFTFRDEMEHLNKTAISRFHQLRLELTEYLDTASVDAHLTTAGGRALDSTATPLPARHNGRVDAAMAARISAPTTNWSVLGPITPELPDEAIQSKIARRQLHPQTPPVCILYTGGSVGMVHKDADDDTSPLVTSAVRNIPPYLQRLNDLPFDLHFWETPEPLDSSNIQPADWTTIARTIQRLYTHYQGFVVLHGTDTMTYTASALSFLFQDLSKPILLTGAERPIAQLLTDAVANIMNAVQLAAPQAIAKPVVPEVCVYFGGKLIRGNRAKKSHSLAFAGFDSPNCELLGTVEDKIEIHTAVVRPPPPDPYGRGGQAVVQLTVDRLDDRVAMFEIYPSTEPCLDLLEHMLTKSDKVRAVVLKTYGTGNAPTLPDRFLKLIESGVRDHGRLIVNLTNCPAGQVEVRLFETNARLFELGVINGGDMTSEAATTKLMWLLAKHARQGDQIDREAIVRDMQIDQRGELRYSVYNLVHTKVRLANVESYSPDSQFIGDIEPGNIDHAYVRVHGIRVESLEPQEFELGLYFQRPRVVPASAENDSRYRVGTVRREWDGSEGQQRDGITFNLDATQVVREHLRTGENLSVQVLPKCAAPVTIETLELAIFTENRKRVA
jgi:L-asparaginase